MRENELVLRGDRVLELRQRAGLTQRALAALTGVSQGQISKIEIGERVAAYSSTVAALAAGLKTNVPFLLGQSDDATPAPVTGSPKGEQAVALLAQMDPKVVETFWRVFRLLAEAVEDASAGTPAECKQ